MELNINSGRLRDYVRILKDSGLKNKYHEPEPPVFLFDARADVLVRSGNEAASYGVAVTSEIITVLMWFDARAENNMYVEWEDRVYQVQHIKPDSTRKGMIITAKTERNT